MQLSFKTLNKQNFTLDAEPTETIGDIKKKIAESQSMSSTAMKLIHSGKIMADEKAVEFYNVKETDQIICMVQKPKAAPVASAAPAAPSTPAPISAQTPSAPAPAAPSSTQNAPATPSPAPAQTARSGGPGGLTMGPEREAAISNLEAMGFERPQVERAMRAAFFNPDRAVEYLLSGIPENVEREQADRLTNRAPQAAAPAPAAGDAPVAQNDDEDEPINLFEAAAAARGGGGGGGAGGGTGQAPARGPNPASSLDALRDNPMFHQLRTLVQQQPQMLESILQQVAASNPDLARAIQSNPDQFIQLLSEGGPEGEMGEMGAMPPGATPVAVTEAERDAIERLCRLGFQRDLAIQAYFACDKNEELAANFLFDHGEEDEE